MPTAESSETVYIDRPVVACDGGTLGHPRGFLDLGDEREVACPYRDRRFVLREAPAEADDDDDF